MDVRPVIASLEAFPASLAALLAGLPDAVLTWRPEAEAWSIADVVGHLLDEERTDFGPRLRATLEDPTRPWPPIDPEGRARERAAAGPIDVPAVLADFTAARADSVAWLRRLERPDLARTADHPILGPLRAGDLLAAWAAHDLLHARQVLERRHQSLVATSAPYVTDYAGAWS